ncbi:hypothetical protein PCANC_13076 [Puccinia coronata f. sp. avenae]|uniref:Uncharacterized protein n=1 Tax=Puccinia coronata f. sp. avenae TaxID=200324 RepID=A0A2N5VNT1_9BASI|nr:hypothetical protein PCANC_13076 [Puccinia coronata f. sp. avenae]PLW51659.1 hypothetical protein PCASD_00530 [Puccinia coronata f. sp. avenae]
MDEESLVDDFFLKKPAPRKQTTSSSSPSTLSTRTPSTATPTSETPRTPRAWAETIPRRPKEQPRSLKLKLKPTPHRPYSTSTPRSTIERSAAIRPPADSPTRVPTSPPSPTALPPPLEFSSPIRSGVSTGLSAALTTSVIPSSTRRTHHTPISSTRKSAHKPLRQTRSPSVQPKPSERVSRAKSDYVLVPDSNDAPEDLPDLIEEPHSDIETHPERDFRNFQEHHDLLPKKLFNSSPAPSPPTKPVSRHSNGTDKGKGKARQFDPCDDLEDVLDEDEKRAKLLAELAFGEDEEATRAEQPEECIAFSSSPIEIVRPCRAGKLADTTASNSKSSVDRRHNGSAKVVELSEWEDELTIHQILSGSTTSSNARPQHVTRTPSQEDQIKHIGVVIDDSEDEDGNLSVGIAPLMDSWTSEKRGVFLKMAGLKSDEHSGDKAAQAQVVEDWDRLLKKGSKRSAGGAKKAVKKTWYNRSFYRAKKKGSKAFKGVGKSTRRVK